MSPKRKTESYEPGSVLAKLKSDRFASFLGIRIAKIEQAYAEANLTVAEQMLNFNGFAHGGLIFSLADTAFTAACNRYDQTAVALSFHIACRRPVQANLRLVAEAEEESSGKSTALYEIVAKTDDQRIVALCEGLAYNLRSRIGSMMGPRRFERLTSRLSAVCIFSVLKRNRMESNLAKLRAHSLVAQCL